MTRVLYAAKPYQAQITVNNDWHITPFWSSDSNTTIDIATQNQLNGLTFHHWEIDGQTVSTANPAILELPQTENEIEVMAVFK